MVKKAIVCLFLCLIFVAPISPSQIYITTIDLYAATFVEPVEKLIVVTVTGRIFILTEYMPDRVAFPLDYFEQQGVHVSDMAMVVHNHLWPSRFSAPDIKTYFLLKSKGFMGRFLVCFPTGEVQEFRGYEQP